MELANQVGRLRKAHVNHPLFLSSARHGKMLELGQAELGPIVRIQQLV
jgi:hypothetical protein